MPNESSNVRPRRFGPWPSRIGRSVFAAAFLATLALFAPPLARKALRVPVCEIAGKFPAKHLLVELNGGASRLAGRRLCNDRLRYRNGMIGNTYASPRRAISKACREVAAEMAFVRQLRARGVPFLLVLAPCKMSFDGTLFPRGWPGCNPNEDAQAVVRLLAEEGVAVLDLVPRFAAARQDVDRHFLVTDHHWNVRTALEATGAICDRLADVLGEPALRGNPRLAPAAWKRHVLERGFVGSHGRRTGSLFSGVEDFEYFLPLFDTQQENEVPGKGKRRTGDFVAAEFNGRYLKPDKREWRWLAYGGPPAGLRMHRNQTPSVDLRCMVVKDSFGRHPVSFLTTVFREVVEVDPRLLDRKRTVVGTVDACRPDVVVMIVNTSSVLGGRWLSGLEKGRTESGGGDAVHVD